MSLRGAIGSLVSQYTNTGESCFSCTHFCDDPEQIEAQLPGLAILSSGHASVRAQDGLCQWHDRVINGRRRCEGFTEQSVESAKKSFG